MLEHIPQILLVILIGYSILHDYVLDGRLRAVALENTAVGWVAVLALLLWGGFFS